MQLKHMPNHVGHHILDAMRDIEEQDLINIVVSVLCVHLMIIRLQFLLDDGGDYHDFMAYLLSQSLVTVSRPA